jgi:hypothetical protein
LSLFFILKSWKILEKNNFYPWLWKILLFSQDFPPNTWR